MAFPISKEYEQKIIEDFNLANASESEKQEILSLVSERFDKVVTFTMVRLLNDDQKKRFSDLMEKENNEEEISSLASEVNGLDVAIEQALLVEYEDIRSGMQV